MERRQRNIYYGSNLYKKIMNNAAYELNLALQLIEKISDEKSIPTTTIQSWMTSLNPEINGVAVDMLLEHPKLVKDLPIEEINNFLLAYLECSIRENPQGQFAYSRYAAGRAIQTWFVRMWTDKETNLPLLTKLRDMLADLSKTGNKDIQNAIVTSVLEHLFDKPEIVRFFDSWRNESVLDQMYSDSCSMAGHFNVSM